MLDTYNNSVNEARYNQTNTYLFFFAYILFILNQFDNIVNLVDIIPESSKYLSLLILSFMVLRNRYSSKIVLINIMLGLIVLGAAIQSNQNLNLIILYLFIFCSVFVNFKSIVRIQFWVLTLSMVIIQILYLKGDIAEISYVTYYRGSNIRYNMGYIYTSFLPNLIFHLALMYIYLKRNLSVFGVVSILLINHYAYLKTYTQSAYYLTILVVIGSYIYFKFNLGYNISKRLKLFIFNISYMFFALFPWYVSDIYDSSINWLYELDDILTGRLRLGNIGIEKYGVTLFGNDIEWIVLEKSLLMREYFFIDSSSLNILLNYGILFFILIVGIFYIISKKIIIVNNNKIFIVVVIVLLLHSAFDPQFLNLLYNPFLLLVGIFINPRGEKRDEINKI